MTPTVLKGALLPRNPHLILNVTHLLVPIIMTLNLKPKALDLHEMNLYKPSTLHNPSGALAPAIAQRGFWEQTVM